MQECTHVPTFMAETLRDVSMPSSLLLFYLPKPVYLLQETVDNVEPGSGRRLLSAHRKLLQTGTGTLDLSGSGVSVGDSTVGASAQAYGHGELDAESLQDNHVEVSFQGKTLKHWQSWYVSQTTIHNHLDCTNIPKHTECYTKCHISGINACAGAFRSPLQIRI